MSEGEKANWLQLLLPSGMIHVRLGWGKVDEKVPTFSSVSLLSRPQGSCLE